MDTYLATPTIIKPSKEKIKHILYKYSDNKYNKEIAHFISTLSKDKNIDLSILFYNLSDLNIISKGFEVLDIPCLLKGKIRRGYYDPKDNKIVEKNNFDEGTLYHELLHVASTIYRGTSFCGLSQESIRRKISIGHYLNEGYTEVLRQRYFKTDDSSYKNAQKISLIIERIIGKENMYECYFSADLKKLINLLSNYNSEKSIIDFLKSDNYEESYKFIKYTYFSKLRKDYISKEITKDEIVKEVSEYILLFKDKNIYDELEKLFGNILDKDSIKSL